jgi:hydroxymethylglutaryl-CoA lyase
VRNCGGPFDGIEGLAYNGQMRPAEIDVDVVVRDVTLRDGLQDADPIDTDAKRTIFDALVAAGIRDLELTSFVRADVIPALADAEVLAAATAGAEPDVTRWALALNVRGAQRALAAGLRHLQYVVSVSDTHSRHNARQPTADALEGLAGVVALARAEGAVVEVTLATAFGCPYELRVPVADVVAAAERATGLGAAALSLADTIGVATPPEVAALVKAVQDATGLPVGAHLHDTRGLAIANALAAVDAGAVHIDGSVGGLGGCPFAPGASGNLPLEDLVHALDAMGVRTGASVGGLVDAARLACSAVGRPVTSHIGVAGPRFVPLADQALP